MLHRLRTLLAFLCLALTLPAAAGGDEQSPPKDSPPPKEQPAPPDTAPADPEEEEPADDPPAPQPDAPSTAAAKPPQPEPPVPAPAGMAYVQAGRVMVGSDPQRLDTLLAGRPPEHKRFFLYETPYHAEFLRPYFIGVFEVTNAQYLRFLQDSAATVYDTSAGSLANIDEVAASLTGLTADQQKDPKSVVWLQLYFTNKDDIWKAVGARLADFLVKRADGSVDELETARKFRFEPLPRGIKLKFYTLAPPANWPDAAPAPGSEDHPVRFVSYNDAERCAEWAGMHLPTEQEWEWAARGPDGFYYPWGNDWPQNELYANWGGKIVDERYMPTTLPVGTRDGRNPLGDKGDKVPLDGDGRSWVGCHHMVGNVAEWTSSWFEPYPGNKFTHSFMGRYVKIIRGGGAGDGEMLALRSACRNYVGAGPDAPPYPENAFQWVGFRLASYMKSGRDQLDPIIRRAVRPKKIREEHLRADRFLGSVTHNWVEPGATPDNHVYVLGRSNVIAIIPQDYFLVDEGMEEMRRGWKRPSRFKTTRGLLKESETEFPFWTLGVLHTDVRLENVLVRKPEPEEKDDKKGSKKRARGRARAPETMKGVCPPGTYLVGVWWGQLALLTPSKEFVCFLKLIENQKTPLEVDHVKPEALGEGVLKVDPDFDWAEIAFDVPLGGDGIDPTTYVRVSTRINFEVGGLQAAGTWIQQDPAKELIAKLRAEYEEAQKAAGKPHKEKDELPK